MSVSLKTAGIADIMEIMQCLPHRYPFLLIDRVEEIDSDNYGVGIKNVTFNEPQFQGHFPAQPVFPGVLIIEAMARRRAASVCSAAALTGRSRSSSIS